MSTSAARPPLRYLLTRQFALAAAIPVLIVVLLWAALALPDEFRRIDRENEQTAALMRSQIEAVLAVPQRSLQLAAALIDAGASTPAMQQTLASTPAFEALYVADAHGVIVDAQARASAGVRAKDLLGLDLSARPFYAATRARKTLVWSDTFLSPLTGQVTAVLAQPLGERLLVADMSLTGLAHELAQHDRPSEAIVIVLDGKGRVIVHPQQQLAARQENMSQLPLVQAALRGQPGSGELVVDGERWIATVEPVRPAGWYVIVAQPRALLFAPLERIGLVACIAVLIALAAAVLLSLRMARKESERYRRLVAAAQALVDRPDTAPDVAFDSEETHALWTRLRGLLDRLQEQEQRASAARRDLSTMLDAATEAAVVATDLKGKVRLFNRGAEKMLGWSAADVVGTATPKIWHDEGEVAARAAQLGRELGRPVNALEAFVCIPRSAGYEVRDWTFVRRDGTRLLASLAMTAVRDADQEITGYLGIAIDQTQRVRAAELELARERAEAASRAKSEFLSRVSHELRTPLNAMLGYAQLLSLDSDKSLGETQRERVGRIETAGWHLVRLIDDVLDLSRIESGRIPLALEAVDLRAVAGEAMRLVAPQAAAHGVAVEPSPTLDAAPALRADRTRLKQVLVNLLSNAIKYNARGGRVELSIVDPDDAQPGIVVADTGRGMDERQLERLFSPFDRLGLESTDIEGTGIGLVITKRLVELMHGRIDVHSTPRVGSRFTVRVPRADRPAPADESPRNTPAVKHGAACGDVVYVEDNEVNAMLMREVFALRPNCTLHLAEDLATGRALIERVHPRLVLVDMHLPDGMGLSLLQWMREHPTLREVPAIVVSADATRAQQEVALRAGARAYLTKPIHVADALQVIDGML